MMNLELADRIAKAVLYEGYILYPYTPSSLKNQQRWTFGGIYPEAYVQAQGSGDSSWMQTEVLVEAGPAAKLDVRVRFLHLQDRTVDEASFHPGDLSDGSDPGFHPVEALQVGSRLYVPWQEAVEREVSASGLSLADLRKRSERSEQLRQIAIAFPAASTSEMVRGSSGKVAGAVVRRQQAVMGQVDISATPAAEAGENLVKISVRISNHTPVEDAASLSHEDAIMRAFVSTHTLLSVRGGQFVSLLDPPAAWQPAVSALQNVGAWPVLVGSAGERDLMLSSPIILYDYPELAAESPGDLFDGTEIDEILTLRILTLTDAEKEEIRQTDERGRELLDRTEALSPDQLRALHGAVRSLRTIGRM